MDNKMGESVTSCGTLQVSVSFGRFENDSLSWEKWSSFSPNKYLEEAEKCKTPGSVAEKKAYFEAHYKKIAARKAELLLEQEKQTNTSSLRSDSPSHEDHSRSNKTSLKFGMFNGYSYSNGQVSPHQDKVETNLIGFSNGIHVDNAIQPGECNDEAPPQVVKQDMNLITDANSNEVEAVTELVGSYNHEAPKQVELDANSIDFVNSTCFHASNEDASISLEPQSSVVEGADQDTVPDSHELQKTEEAVVVHEDTRPKGHHKKVKSLHETVTRSGTNLQKEQKSDLLNVQIKSQKISPAKMEKNLPGLNKKPVSSSPKLNVPIKSQKVGPTKMEKKLMGLNKKPLSSSPKLNVPIKSEKISPAKMEKNLSGLNKKLVSSSPKTPKIPTTPKLSKPTTISTVSHASRTPPNKSNNSSLPIRKAAPTSPHMSLSTGSANSDLTSHTSTRKSFIMEKMGDKDIVKRIFKTFQNDFNQLRSPSDERSLGKKPVSTKVMEQEVPNSLNLQEKNERTRKSAEKANVERDQSGTRNIMSSGSSKQAGADQRTVKAAPTSFGLRSGERGKEGEKDAEIKRLRQRLGFKATPMPGLYQGQGKSKNVSDKD